MHRCACSHPTATAGNRWLTHAMAANPAHAHSMHSNLGGMGVAGGAAGHHMSAHKIYEETQHHDASIYHEPYRCARVIIRKSNCERFPDLLFSRFHDRDMALLMFHIFVLCPRGQIFAYHFRIKKGERGRVPFPLAPLHISSPRETSHFCTLDRAPRPRLLYQFFSKNVRKAGSIVRSS